MKNRTHARKKKLQKYFQQLDSHIQIKQLSNSLRKTEITTNQQLKPSIATLKKNTIAYLDSILVNGVSNLNVELDQIHKDLNLLLFNNAV